MQHISDTMIDDLVSPTKAQQVLLDAFRRFGSDQAAMQPRIRTESDGVKISTLAAVIPAQGVAGAKIYTTINGKFSFVILLFSTEDGRPLASFDANAITRLRTAASSVIAARYLARPDSSRLAIFGVGTQGREHIRQMVTAFPIDHISLCTPNPEPGLARRLSDRYRLDVELCRAEQALEGADIIVTATRSTTPLFSVEQLPGGCFIAAIGSSLPHARELDDAALRRASMVAVEWRTQSLQEAGDLVLAAPGVLSASKIVELGELVTGKVTVHRAPDDIMIYKSVGIGLEDIALAGLAWQRFLAT